MNRTEAIEHALNLLHKALNSRDRDDNNKGMRESMDVLKSHARFSPSLKEACDELSKGLHARTEAKQRDHIRNSYDQLGGRRELLQHSLETKEQEKLKQEKLDRDRDRELERIGQRELERERNREHERGYGFGR